MTGSFLGPFWKAGVVLLLVAGSLGSGGGCSCTGNPRTDDYFCAQRNMTTYQSQVTQRQETAENAQDENERLRRENQDLAAQQQDLNQQIDSVSQQLRTLDADLAKLDDRLKKAKSNNAVNQQKVAELSRQLQRVQDQTKLAESDLSGTVAERTAELERLKKQHDALEAEIDAIIK